MSSVTVQTKDWAKFVSKQRKQLVAKKRQLEDQFQCLQEPDCSGARGDLADQATAFQDRSESNAKKKQLELKISEYGTAIKSIDSETYGVCAVCGEQIPIERLQAMPLATTHVSCSDGRRAQ